MTTALVLIDIQEDYFPGGAMELVGPINACEAASRLLNAFRLKDLTIIHIQHIAIREGSTFFVPGTRGININDNVKPLVGETVIKKHYPNSFRETELNNVLNNKEIGRIVVCGMMSHMCVDATVRDAFDRGYRCIVAHDACATRDLTFNGVHVPAEHVHAGFMAALGAVYAQVVSSDEAIGMLGEYYA